MLLPMPDLDGFGHAYGITGAPYRAHLEFLDTSIATLASQYRAAHPDGHIFVISDHGMVNVTRGITLDIEAYVGKAASQTYVYFTDANLLRVWVVDQGIKDNIQRLFTAIGRRAVSDPGRAPNLRIDLTRLW